MTDKTRIDKAEIDRAREKANQIIRRALNEPRFREEIMRNPRKALEGAGLESGPANDLYNELSIDGRRPYDDEEEQERQCWVTCWVTCLWSPLG
jgi:hypothetical protein